MLCNVKLYSISNHIILTYIIHEISTVGSGGIGPALGGFEFKLGMLMSMRAMILGFQPPRFGVSRFELAKTDHRKMPNGS